MARKRPVMAKLDMRRPARPADWLKASIRRGMTGGTLNWFKVAAILVRRTIIRMNHGDRSDFSVLRGSFETPLSCMFSSPESDSCPISHFPQFLGKVNDNVSHSCILCTYSAFFVMSENRDIFVWFLLFYLFFHIFTIADNFCYPIEGFGTNYATKIGVQERVDGYS
jgi:hypothetical protein